MVAACVTALEGLALIAAGVLEMLALSGERLTMGLTTAGFFIAVGAGLIYCALSLVRLHSWARSPVVLAQLFGLGMAWSFRGGETTLISGVLAVVAVVGLIAILHPRSIRALADV